MFYHQANETRKQFYKSWAKFLNKEILSPLEQQIVDVINLHPEYHTLLNDSSTIDSNYSPELGQTNPFLHMGLHLALREQISTNRPAGIQKIFHQLQLRKNDIMGVEHTMIDCLARFLWEAQQKQSMPDERAYLEALKRLV